MAKTRDVLKNLSELPDGGLPPENGAPPVEEAEPLEEKIQREEYKLDKADREKIDAILLSSDVQKGGKIRLERKGPLDREYQYIQTIPAEQWNTDDTYEYLRKMFGGGDYKAMTFRANGQIYRPFSFSIDYRYKGQLDQQDIERLKTPKESEMALKMMEAMKPAPDAFKSSDMIRIMEMSSNKSEQMMTLIMTMMMKSQETSTQMMTAMITAMVGKPATESKVDATIIELLRAKQERQPMMEVLEMMKAIKELNDPPKDEEKEENMFEKLLRLAPAIIPALTGQSAPVTQAGQPAQIPAGAAPKGVVDQLPLAMKVAVAGLVKAAERNADVELYADMVFDNIDESNLRGLRNILTASDWKAKLFGDENKVAHVGPWLDQLRILILQPDADTSTNSGHDDPAGQAIPPERSGA